jgi:hypothetical protein
MARALPSIVAPQPEVETTADPRPDQRPDLRRLAQSTSLGSYVLRWQLAQPATPRNAAVA